MSIRGRRQRFLDRIARLPWWARRALFWGSRRTCPLCGLSSSVFLPHGARLRFDARCPFCSSLERHRLDWLYLQRRTSLLDGRPKRLLHVAPEECVARKLRSLASIDYLSGDLSMRTAMVKMDLTQIQFPDGSFDVILCSHVLEHIPDDRKAMSELYRVLRPGGWALIQVPVTGRPTVEDPSVTDPAERERRFGQHDHVRIYGPDFKERLEAAGFHVRVELPEGFVAPAEIGRFGLRASARIFHSEKRSP